MVVVYEPGFPTHGKFVMVTTGGIKVAIQLAKECGVSACEMVQPTKAYLWNSGTPSYNFLILFYFNFIFLFNFYFLFFTFTFTFYPNFLIFIIYLLLFSLTFCVDEVEQSFSNLVEISKLYEMYIERVEAPMGELLASIVNISIS